MTDTADIGELVKRIEYAVGNPSDWDTYDEGKSEMLREAARALTALEAERDAANFAARHGASLSEDAIHAIREMLAAHDVPAAAFIDDHVGNAIAQRDEARAELATLRDRIEREPVVNDERVEVAAEALYHSWANYPACSDTRPWSVEAEKMPGKAAHFRKHARAVLEAALASAPGRVEAEPVAWRYKLYVTDPSWTVSVQRPKGAIVEPLFASPPAPVVTDTLIEAAQDIIKTMSSTYQARNGRRMSIEADDGEKCWIVHSDQIAALEAALASREAS